jgi:NADH-quinone oxidoreductase subunit H
MVNALLGLVLFPGIFYLVAMALLLAWVDRKFVALWQGRVGPPIYQPLADVIKLLAKEDILPQGTDIAMATLLPLAAMVSAMTAGMFIPVGNAVLYSFEGDLVIALFLLSVPSLAYFLAGWVTPSVYGVLGGNRSLLQYFSYEVPLLLGMFAPAIYARSWSVMTLMDAQRGYHWYLLLFPVGFFVALLGLLGKLERVPFDLPHAKSEIGAGPLTEYSGRKLALWRLSHLVQTLVGINLVVAVYLGGVDRLWLHWGFPVYLVKIFSFMVLLSLIQALYARVRIDQLVDLGWKILVPLGMVQILVAVFLGGW